MNDILTENFIKALIWQESEGVADAIGDRDLTYSAYGILQIRWPYVRDVNRAFGTTYRARMCLNNPELSIEIFKKYMSLYATEKQLGRPVTQEDIARIHNGGPKGYKMVSTLGYWNAVQKKMVQLDNGSCPLRILEKLNTYV